MTSSLKASFSIYYQNVRGMNTKQLAFICFPDLLHYSIYIITESWLKPNVVSSDFFDPILFNVFRRDRVDRGGGGVLVAVSTTINVSPIDCKDLNYNSTIIDLVGLLITKNNFTFLLLSIYIPPDISISFFATFFSDLLDSQIIFSYPLFIIGDFNCHLDSKNNKANIFKNFMLTLTH